MNLDDQIRRYFGTPDLTAVSPDALNAGIEHMKVALQALAQRRNPGAKPSLPVVPQDAAIFGHHRMSGTRHRIRSRQD
jgi:hypothetical protein